MLWLVTTTLNNNLLRAKFPPLLAAFPDLELVLVTDHVGPKLERVRYVVPSRLSTKLFGRLLSRELVLFREIASRRVQRVMVYNAVPHLLLAFLPSEIFRKPIDLHMIAGQLDLDFANRPRVMVNRVVRKLKNPALLEKLFRWMAFKHVNRFFVPGHRARQWLITKGVAPQRIHILHSAVEVKRFAPTSAPRDMDVLIVANLHPRKRPELTIQILEQVLVARPQSRFAWIGEGYVRDQVHASVKASPIRDAVEMVGHTDEVVRYYQRSKIFLLNSVSEGLSLAAMEAMASGCVPVAADVGDMPEVVKNGETGILIEPDAPADRYAAAILTLLADPASHQRLSAAARDLITREHSYNAMTETWLQVL